MLGKLIKHEFKAVNRLMIPLHLGLILITIVGRFYVQFAMNHSTLPYSPAYNVWESIINATLIMFYVIALAAVCIVTSLYLCVLRFRKNLFTDEGYLMHTLPVSAAAHIWSKLIVAFIWMMIDGLLLVLSIAAMFINMDFLRDFGELWSALVTGFPDAFGVPFGIGIPLFLIIGILDGLSSILIVYMCIAIGHSFNSHKILSSVGVYIGITVVTNLLSSIFMALTGFNRYGNSSLFIGASSSASSTAYFWGSFWFSAILSILMGTGAYLLTNYFMTKRLNLE